VKIASAAACIGVTVGASSALSQTGPTDGGVGTGAVTAAEADKGIVPIPDYGGDIWSRAFLSGDWGGTRTEWANKGFQADLRWNNYVQSVVSGGRDIDTRFGGGADYLFNFDLMRMGILPGALVKLRAESRYGESVNGLSGLILPVNTDAFFPLTDQIDRDIPFTITTLSYTQFLSEKFAFFLGKFDTLDGDPNEFASGRGTSQFMNANFVFNAALSLRLPYSTLGGGVVWLPAHGVSVSSSIFNTADSSTQSGFDDFGDGLSWATEVDFQYRLGHLPGGMNIGFLYSFDQEFAKIGDRLIFQPGEGLSFTTDDDTWAIFWSGWQYLWTRDANDAPIRPGDGRVDHRGFGLFARVGFADQDTNPLEWSLSGGIGGRGLISSRQDDSFGVGYFYNSIQTARLSGIAGIDDVSQGLEAYYDIAITTAAHLTLDFQVIDGVSEQVDTTYLLGARLALSF
jgi:porin